VQITIEKSGPSQLGAYRDSVSGYIITLSEPIRSFSPDQLQQYIVGLAMAACERPGHTAQSKEESGFLQPYVDEVKQVSSTQWRIKIVHPYTD
jgi:hypothetical protein